MAQFNPGIKLPFTTFPGIPNEDSRRIWRDFEELLRNINPSPGLFDASIDPILTASNPGTHQYKNLTDLLANESWTDTFNVAVHQRTGVPITEPAVCAMTASHKNLHLFGTNFHEFAGSQFAGWQWKGFTMNSSHLVVYSGLSFDPPAACVMQSGGTFYMRNCLMGTNFVGWNSLGSSAGSGPSYLWDTYIAGGAYPVTGGGGTAINVFAWNCIFNGTTVTVGGQGEFHVFGGGTDTNGATINATGGNVNVHTGGDWSFNVGPGAVGGRVTVELDGGVNGGNYTSSSTNTPEDVKGHWNTVSFTGVGTSTYRSFRGTAASITATGPIFIDAASYNQSFGDHAVLQGDTVYANLGQFAGRIECLGLTNSFVKAEFMVTNATYYTIDNASHNNLFIFGGTHNTNFQTASVSIGTGLKNRIITEDTDSIISSPPASAIPSNIIPAIFVETFGVQVIPTPAATVSTDNWRKDFVLADMVGPVPGMGVIPPAAPGSAPTGPAGGSLNGTYPNPTFAGRDSSFDKIDQDLLIGNLAIERNGLQRYPDPTTTAIAVDFSQAFMLMGG